MFTEGITSAAFLTTRTNIIFSRYLFFLSTIYIYTALSMINKTNSVWIWQWMGWTRYGLFHFSGGIATGDFACSYRCYCGLVRWRIEMPFGVGSDGNTRNIALDGDLLSQKVGAGADPKILEREDGKGAKSRTERRRRERRWGVWGASPRKFWKIRCDFLQSGIYFWDQNGLG